MRSPYLLPVLAVFLFPASQVGCSGNQDAKSVVTSATIPKGKVSIIPPAKADALPAKPAEGGDQETEDGGSIGNN